MPKFDLVIQGGMVIDGTHTPRYRADLGIKNGKIAKIGRLRAQDGKKVLDASGLMGLDGAKSGRQPTPAEHQEMCRLLHEGMDAGGCGWSAQRLGVNSVQMDYDGTPMVTDIMHNETALGFARVLAERNEGFMQ